MARKFGERSSAAFGNYAQFPQTAGIKGQEFIGFTPMYAVQNYSFGEVFGHMDSIQLLADSL